jgi:hypothetical protein
MALLSMNFFHIFNLRFDVYSATQNLFEKVSRIAEQFESLAVSSPVSSLPTVKGGWMHCRPHMPNEEVSTGRRIKIARRKGASSLARGQQDTSTARRLIPGQSSAEIGNPAPLTPDSSGVACRPDAWQAQVSICGVLNSKS